MLSSCARSRADDADGWALARELGTPRNGADPMLARAAAQGQRAAQRELFRRLAAPVHEVLYAVLGSNDQMEEHLQRAFVEIFRALATHDREVDVETWACALAARCARCCREARS